MSSQSQSPLTVAFWPAVYWCGSALRRSSGRSIRKWTCSIAISIRPEAHWTGPEKNSKLHAHNAKPNHRDHRCTQRNTESAEENPRSEESSAQPARLAPALSEDAALALLKSPDATAEALAQLARNPIVSKSRKVLVALA